MVPMMRCMRAEPLARLIPKANISTSPAKLFLKNEAPFKWFDHPGKKTVKDTPGAARKALRLEGEEAMEMYERLRRHGVRPHIPLVLATIRACVFRGELVKIHGDLVKSKDDQDTSVCNALVEAFAKAGGLKDSREVFDRAPKRDIITWNTMMGCYIKNAEPAKALELFTRITSDGLLPNTKTFLLALNACSLQAAGEEQQEIDGRLVKPLSLKIGSDIHSQLVRSQHDLDTFVESALVEMYARCGNVEEAQKIFDGMEKHDSVSWAALIFGYSGSRGDWALKLFTWMKEEGFIPDTRAFTAALAACSGLARREEWKRVHGKLIKPVSLERGRALHVELDKVGVRVDNDLESALVDMYCKCGSLVEARRVFDKMFRHDTVVWTSLILGYADYGDGDEALQLFARMQGLGVRPDSRAFIAALAACGILATTKGKSIDQGFMVKLAMEKGLAIHSQISRVGLESNVFVTNALLEMYFKCGSFGDAEKVFDRAVNRNAGSWNSMILGYAVNGRGGEALRVFSTMQQLGVKPTTPTFVAALKACGNLIRLETGKLLHSEAEAYVGLEISWSPDLVSSLVEFYGKCGCMEEAQRVFDEADSHDLATWNALLSGYSSSGDSDRVFQLFERMEELELEVDGATMLAILKACNCAELVERGKTIFGEMSWKHTVTPAIEHYRCVVDLLGRANELGEAVRLIREARVEGSSLIWMTLLEACFRWKNVEVGKLAFQSALEATTATPNAGAAYVLMANIYADAGLWGDCRRIELMANPRISSDCHWVDNAGVIYRFPRAPEEQLLRA